MLPLEGLRTQARAEAQARRELAARSKMKDAWEHTVDEWTYWDGGRAIPWTFNATVDVDVDTIDELTFSYAGAWTLHPYSRWQDIHFPVRVWRDRAMVEPDGPRIIMRIKADQDCASVAAASVIAKVKRDALMTRLHAEHPEYGWDGNKGYGAAVHTDAIRAHGVTQYHRTSWNLGV